MRFVNELISPTACRVMAKRLRDVCTCRQISFTTSLNPAFSPRRRSHVRRVFGKTSGGIGRTVCGDTSSGLRPPSPHPTRLHPISARRMRRRNLFCGRFPSVAAARQRWAD